MPGRPSRHAVHQRLQTVISDLTRRGGPPPPSVARGIWRQVWFLECHNSTAIEGNTLVLREVERLLAEGMAVGDKPLADYLEVQGYAEAAAWVYEQAVGTPDLAHGDLLTLTEIRRVHQMALARVWELRPHPDASPDEDPGNWRRHDHEPFPGGMRTVPFVDVPSRVADWVGEANRTRRSLPGLVEDLARLHCGFEQVHPFLDGNGRAGRLILNLLLVRLGYPPLVVLKQDRARYLSALRRADAGDPAPLGEFLSRCLIQSAERFVLPLITAEVDPVPLASLVSSEFSHVTLQRAVERGRLRAVRGEDGRYLSSRAWLDEYRESRWRRTPRAETRSKSSV